VGVGVDFLAFMSGLLAIRTSVAVHQRPCKTCNDLALASGAKHRQSVPLLAATGGNLLGKQAIMQNRLQHLCGI